jgi:probable phosphoglycerate mutase
MTGAVVHLVRHGRTAWHRPNRYAGRSDIELDETGTAQAERLAGWAARAGLAAVAASPLRRAVCTAAPAAAATGLALSVEPRLRELDFGIAEGRTLDDVRATHPDAAARFVADPAGCPFPGGEALADAVARARAALDELAARYPDGSVLVVTHSTLIRLVVCAVLGIPLGEYRRRLPALDPVARTSLRFGQPGAPIGLLAYNAPLDPGCVL